MTLLFWEKSAADLEWECGRARPFVFYFTYKYKCVVRLVVANVNFQNSY